mmetsp:Transcript_2966/g.9079  ORF Transcript_2966/g.9079 Transcript_2966/m.9079 type:complete len:729 (+) Transcript_2966:263-2449(+)|eukprot:CAMPEP_0198735844 /NCGR_PEP_ID=MMETSP1475-20131203/62010_1 /TAXON_ID= ORGANISM="Unidentified sp., Strain CCMP1999" /NCGR_SAMPLE_ID=MMETSP1475 /ASSEMBLY_ACC=CAM_ASM_001111 /LENGTH=728 /DNA_ID=CAMNT_0044499567 /DNA_START=170 /DNA_END=2356 /DNA_ORIENTATION=+
MSMSKAIVEAPTYYPTAAEFSDPLAYIRQIRAEASLSGICKIIPPEGWNPPCLVKDSLHFTTTMQSSHKLKNRSPPCEAFMRRLRWFYQQERRKHKEQLRSGKTLTGPPPRLRFPPRVKVTDKHGTGLDLQQLYLTVREAKQDQQPINWTKVAHDMRLYHSSNPQELAMIYELYLAQYEKKCQKYGDDFLEKLEKQVIESRREEKYKGKSAAQVNRDTRAIKCTKCSVGNYEAELLLCDACDSGWHLFCLVPPMKKLPPDDELWFCPNCDKRADKEFGFDIGEEFTLEEYKEYANTYKRNWFRHRGRDPDIDEIEKEYWDIVNDAKQLVYVPYGSDLDTREVGSGFPNPREEKHVIEEYDKYLRCPWNLNIFPELNGSLLSYLAESIKGVTVPWLYVGMLFASFCYHTEDSYMYSINYHHFGAPKIWYGTSGGLGAAHFEAAMRSAAPHLFEANPGLFYHLTTMVSPADLAQRGARIVRAVQRPGEYIITFPQAYHGGFSTGFNCAEAVNFITADWIPFGRAASARYKIYKWEPIFCHEEIILRAVFSPYFARKTFPRDAKLLYYEVARIIQDERRSRVEVLSSVSYRRRVNLDYLKVHRCAVCQQTSVLSAVELPSMDGGKPRIYCTDHWKTTVKSRKEDPTALYTYTDEELSNVLEKAKNVTYAKLLESDELKPLKPGLGRQSTNLMKEQEDRGLAAKQQLSQFCVMPKKSNMKKENKECEMIVID